MENDRGWPKTGRTLWKRIREVTPLLEAYGIKAGRCGSNKIGRPIVLERIGPSNDGDKIDAGGGDDKGDDNRPGDDKGDDIFAVSSPQNPHGNAPGDDNGAGGRYFGATISSDKKEEGGDWEQGESNPDLSSPSSPNGAQGAQKAPREKRRLTTEEAERVQRFISEGMKAEFARAEVLGEEA